MDYSFTTPRRPFSIRFVHTRSAETRLPLDNASLGDITKMGGTTISIHDQPLARLAATPPYYFVYNFPSKHHQLVSSFGSIAFSPYTFLSILSSPPLCYLDLLLLASSLSLSSSAMHGSRFELERGNGN